MSEKSVKVSDLVIMVLVTLVQGLSLLLISVVFHMSIKCKLWLVDQSQLEIKSDPDAHVFPDHGPSKQRNYTLQYKLTLRIV